MGEGEEPKQKVLFIAEIRGKLTQINELAKQHGATAVVNTSAFGFYDAKSASRINIRTMRKNIATYSPLIDVEQIPIGDDDLRAFMADKISELPLFLSGEARFDVPVYTTWGSVDDLAVVEKFRSGEYSVPNLFILDEKHSYNVGGLRLCGLGGAFRPGSLFDAGEASLTIPGSTLSLWIGAWQLGELLNTLKAHKEPKLFVSHASVLQNPLLEWFSMALKAKYTVSANLHLPYCSVVNRQAVDGPSLANYDVLAATVKDQWEPVWSAAKGQVQQTEDQVARTYSLAAAGLFELYQRKQILKTPYRLLWHFGLTDIGSGYVLGDLQGGNMETCIKSAGKDIRRRKQPAKALPQAEKVHAIFMKTDLLQEEAIKKIAPEDQSEIIKVVFENSAYIIHFASAEKTQDAYTRVDKSDLPKCYVYHPNHHAKPYHKGGRGRRVKR